MTSGGSWGAAAVTGVTDPLHNLHLSAEQIARRVHIRNRRATLCRPPLLGGYQMRWQS
jgi:hypothetical protein